MGVRGDLKGFKDKLMNALEILNDGMRPEIARSVTAVCKILPECLEANGSTAKPSRNGCRSNLLSLAWRSRGTMELSPTRHMRRVLQPAMWISATKWILQAAMDLRQEKAESAALGGSAITSTERRG